MIYPQTILTVADNTGAKKVMCIQILGGNKKYAEIGHFIHLRVPFLPASVHPRVWYK